MVAPRHLPASSHSGSRVLLRPVLSAALAFADAAWDDALHFQALVAWFDRFLVKPGVMSMPPSVHEPSTGVASLRDVPTGAWVRPFEIRLAQIVTTTRSRVSTALGGLIRSPVDDRFLAAAIFAGRVVRGDGRAEGWRPCPKSTDRLSDIVLSLFAADVLSHRDEYDASLCVCGICGRVALLRGASARTRCAEHL
jgi:hypothetical protein